MSGQQDYYHYERPELVVQVPQGAARVLDVGCGAGAMAAAIRRDRGATEVWGMEVVPEVAAEAEANPALDKVLTGDAGQLVEQLPKAYFDCIVAGDVLEHLVDPWVVLARLRESLAPGGVFVCSIPNIRNFSFILKLLFGKRFEYKDSGVMDRTHLRFFARKDVQLLFEGAGFRSISIGPVRPKKGFLKRLARALFGDLVIKGFLITAMNRPA